MMQSNKTSKKTTKTAAENVASPENAVTGEATAKPRTSRSSKPKSETGETASMKLHRKATSIPQESAPAKDSALSGSHSAPAAKAMAASVVSGFTEAPSTAASAPFGVSHEEIARLAHSYSVERGNRHGSPEDDWLRAERELLSRR